MTTSRPPAADAASPADPAHTADPADPVDPIELRPVAPDDIRAFLEPVLLAFRDEFNESEYQADRPLWEPDRLVSAWDGAVRVGGAGAYSFRMRVPGGQIPVSGITAVGVRPDHTRRGVLRRMMRWLFDDAMARHEPAAILWASEATIYQRFGFGQATQFTQFEAERHRVVFLDPISPSTDARIRMLPSVDEAMDILPALYVEATKDVPGSIERSDIRWRNLILADEEWARRGKGPQFRAVLEIDGVPRGYAIHRAGGEWSPRGPMGQTNVMEVVALDVESERRLWTWLIEQDLTTKVAVVRGPVPHPLLLMVEEPRRLGATVTDALWLRLLDVPAALTARTYTQAGRINFELTDPMIDSNAGRWQLTVRADGSASCERTTADADLALDVAALACAYLGAHRFTDLLAAGRLRERRPGAALEASILFLPPRAPYTNTFF